MFSVRYRLIMPASLGFVLALALALGGPAQAGYVVNLTEVGGDVVAIGSGTIDTTGLNFLESGGDYSILGPGGATALFGGASHYPGVAADVFISISGPSSFGPSNLNVSASSATGDLVGIVDDYYLLVPRNYISGSLLNSTSTWSGKTFASLGVTPGTYTWTWGSGAHADSFTMNIGPSSVPEPASLIMLGTGAVGMLGYARRRKVRATANIA